MTRRASILALSLAVLCFTLLAADTPTSGAHTIGLTDIIQWKHIATPEASPDGQWFAYQLTPTEGDAEVILKNVKDGKETRFPIGEIPQPAANGGGGRGGAGAGAPSRLAFSDDSHWLAFTVFPKTAEAKRLKRDKKPAYQKTVLIELATGKKTEFEKIRRFAFSGDRATYIALHRYAPESTPPAEKPKWSGSDLILRELSTGNELNIGNVSEFAFDKKGDWFAWVIDAQDKVGNGIQVRSLASGSVMALDSDAANYKGLSWTDKGDGLAALKGVEDKGYEDKLYTVLGFTNFGAGAPVKVAFDPKSDKSFPSNMSISPNRTPFFMEDLSAIAFGIAEIKPKKKDDKKDADASDAPGGRGGARAEEEELPTLELWHWQDRRLPSQQEVEETRDKNFNYFALYRVAEKKFIRLADEGCRDVALNAYDAVALGSNDMPYEREASLDGRRYRDIYSIDLKTGDRKLALKQARWGFTQSPDGRLFAYYENGNFYVYDLVAGKSTNITKGVAASFINTEDDHNVEKPPTAFLGWTKSSDAVLLSDEWDVWKVPVEGGAAVNLTVNGKKQAIRYRTHFRLDPEERGIDFSQPVYFNAYGEWTKKGGIVRIDPGRAGVQTLLWSDAGYPNLIKAKHSDAYFYTRETNEDFPDYYSTGASLADGKKITDADPQQKDFLWSKGVKLIDYTSDKGDKLQGALFLPANYEAGKSYPTIVYIYEKLSQGLNQYSVPFYNGFNKSVYTSNGYAVLEPDITYKVNDPGMSAVWCVIPALKAAIKTGIVDAKRVGLHGHSWGGYQTAFLVTQTDMFKAAIAGAPLTDMIAMYNAIYWNTGSANQPIFESSQGRFTGGPWEVPDAYVRNSPVYHAANVHTPLMILHNDKDGAVDRTQGIEYFNTLRRMQKPVFMLDYKGENHGLREPINQKDYTVRMKEYFDHYLMDKPAPQWLSEGIPVIKMKEHLEERVKEESVPASKTAKTPGAGGGDPR